MPSLDGMACVLRDFERRRSDYSGIARVVTAVWPEDPTTARQLERQDGNRDPDLISGRIVAERDGRIIAFGVFGQTSVSPVRREFYLNVLVHPDHRRQGTGRAIYDHILSAVSRHRPEILVADTRESQPDAVGFLDRRGFEIVQRRPVLRLDMKASDGARLRSGRTHNSGQEITVSALSDLMHAVPDWKRRCWELDWEIVQDIPSPDPPARATFEQYAQVFEDPAFLRQSWFIALQGDEWVGMSVMETETATPGTFYTHVTGVRRGYRRRGIATALKLRGIEHVQASGGRFIETDNDENNPILGLNLALGFETGPAILEFRKTL